MINILQTKLIDYTVRLIEEKDFQALYELEKNNIKYFNYTKETPDYNSIISEVYELPPNKTLEDKYFIGFFKDNELIAVMDLIDGYPNNQTYFIGLFMIDIKYQNKGIGSYIIKTMISHTHKHIRLGCLSNNKEGYAFWSHLGFKDINTVYNKEKDWEIIVMER